MSPKNNHRPSIGRISVCFLLLIALFAARTSSAQHVPDVPGDPARLPCGIMDPHSQYMVTADTGASKSGALERFDPVVAGTALAQNTGDGYPYNGSGAATANIRTLCLLVFPGDERSVYTTLNIVTSMMSQSGCCGGLQPGGQAYAQPEWQSSLILPGSEGDSPWIFKVVLNTSVSSSSDVPISKPSGKCSLSIDGNATGHDLDQTSPSASFVEHVSSGPHALKFQCPQYGLNLRGAGRVIHSNAEIEQTLYLSASKSVAAKSPQGMGQSMPLASNPAVAGAGCVEAGVEGGCFVLHDSKSGTTFNLFFKDDFPKLNTAISFQGIENGNPNFCMQGKAVDVTKWTPIRMHCPQPSSKEDSAQAMSGNKLQCAGWNAWYNIQPPGPKTLHVAGVCTLKIGYTAKLVPHVPPGFNPQIYILDLVITAPKTPRQSNAVIFVPVHYTERTNTQYESADIEPDHVSVPVKVIQ